MTRLVIFICVAAFACAGCAGLGRQDRAAYNRHLMKGEHYLSSNKYAESSQEFIKAVTLGQKINKTVVPTIMLGESYVKGNEIGKARNIANDAIKKWPREASAWELAGKVELKENKLQEAESSFEKALSFAKKKGDKERIESLLSLTRGLMSYSNANLQSAKQCFAEIKDKQLAKDVKDKSGKILGIEMGK